MNQQLGWSQSNVQNYINNRLTVPSYVDIDVNMVGNSFGGTANYTVTVEQDPGISGEIKIWSAIVESNEVASSAYGVYSGQVMMWEPRAFPLGYTGQVISVTGPYPQTIYASGDYTLDPSEHTFDNLDIVTYVQASTGSREVLNANFMDVPDTATGIYGDEITEPSITDLVVGPNPSAGIVNVSSTLPQGVTGTVQIFDMSGRVIDSFAAGEEAVAEITDNGVYFVHLGTSTGETLRRRLTVIR